MVVNTDKLVHNEVEDMILDYIERHPDKIDREIAAELSLTKSQVERCKFNNGIISDNNKFSKHMIYALYKGDNLMADGNVFEIAATVGTRPETIRFYGTSTYMSRTSERARRLVFLYDERKEN